MTLTIELPEPLAQQAQARGISQQRLEEAIIHVIRIYLQQRQIEVLLSTEPAWIGGNEFAHRVIANNRELFEELAQL